MPTSADHAHDVFVSYSQSDQRWVQSELLPRLEQAGLRYYLDHRDTAVGAITLAAIDQAIEHSRKILLILTPDWIKNESNQLQGHLAQFRDPIGRTPRVVPLILKPCTLPPWLAILSAANLSDDSEAGAEWDRLLRSLDRRTSVYIAYDRQNKPDRVLALRIHQQLRQAGHNVTSSMDVRIGQDWALALQSQLEQSDYVVVLLSEIAIRNEIFLKMVEHAYWANQRLSGQARLLPIRANYSNPLPHPLNTYLDPLHYAEWRPRTKQSMRQVAAQILEAIVSNKKLPAVQQERVVNSEPTTSAPLPSADARFIQSLPSPGGVMNPLEVLYIKRDADRALQRELKKSRGTTVTIRGSRQSGKSSLLIRGIDQARRTGSSSVFINLEPIDKTYLEDSDTFFRYFAGTIVHDLALDSGQVDHYWNAPTDPTTKITRLIEEYVLKQIPHKLIIAIDEADRVWGSPINDSFFGLLRHWHSIRAVNDLLWPRLSVLVAISTEPHLVITSAYQSPFNIGSRIELGDFAPEQVHDLHLRYRTPLVAQQLAELVELLNGHPYLSSKALYMVVNEEMTWDEIKRTASSDRGPFNDHLRRYWWLLRDQPYLVEQLKNMLKDQHCTDDAFHRLSRAGLIKGDDGRRCEFRCKLYENYFRRKL